MEGRAFTAVGIVGLQRRRRRRLRVVRQRRPPAPELLHDTEVGIELFLDQLFRRDRFQMLFFFLISFTLPDRKSSLPAAPSGPRKW